MYYKNKLEKLSNLKQSGNLLKFARTNRGDNNFTEFRIEQVEILYEGKYKIAIKFPLPSKKGYLTMYVYKNSITLYPNNVIGISEYSYKYCFPHNLFNNEIVWQKPINLKNTGKYKYYYN